MLFGLISSILRFITSIVLLPLRMLSRNFVGTILLFGAIYLFWPSHDTTQPTQAPPTKQATGKSAGAIKPEVQAIKRFEDGNSKFSSDLLSQMTPPELRHYSSVFFWVMRYQKEGQSHVWSMYNIQGTMTPFGIFKNSFGHQCRKFKEVLKVHDIQQTLNGIACERTDGGWCRLRYDSTPLCGIGEKGGSFKGLGDKLKSIF